MREKICAGAERSAGPRDNGLPGLTHRTCRHGAGTAGTGIGCHDVSGIGMQTLALASVSMKIMQPWWQTGHSFKETPVSSSW